MYVSAHTMSLHAEQISIKEFSINYSSFYDQETIVRFYFYLLVGARVRYSSISWVFSLGLVLAYSVALWLWFRSFILHGTKLRIMCTGKYWYWYLSGIMKLIKCRVRIQLGYD